MKHQTSFTLRLVIEACISLGLALAFQVEAAVVIKPTAYDEFPDAIRVSNDSTELIVVPSIGRIVRYSLKNGENALWESKSHKGAVWKVGNWPNWGGDKIWLWPQDLWSTRSGKSWPPPGDGADQAWKAEILGNKVRLTGPLFEGFGCRAIREIELAETGSTVTLTTQFKSEGAAPVPGVAPWSITQVPSNAQFYARLIDGAEAITSGTDRWPEPRTIGNVMCFSRDGSRNAKSFFEADVLAAVQGNQLFSLTLITNDTTKSKYLSAERAQIYSSPDQDKLRPAELKSYVELEFTAPRSVESENSILIVKWNLQRLEDEKHSPEEIARRLNALSK